MWIVLWFLKVNFNHIRIIKITKERERRGEQRLEIIRKKLLSSDWWWKVEAHWLEPIKLIHIRVSNILFMFERSMSWFSFDVRRITSTPPPHRTSCYHLKFIIITRSSELHWFTPEFVANSIYSGDPSRNQKSRSRSKEKSENTCAIDVKHSSSGKMSLSEFESCCHFAINGGIRMSR